MEKRIAKAKEDYSLALKRLEGISYEIHEKRKLKVLNNGGNETCPVFSPIPEFRKLSLISSTPNRTGKCTAVVYPWTSDEGSQVASMSSVVGGGYSHHVSASLSSYSNVSDCESELGSVETLDTLDDSAINHLMLGSEIEAHLRTYMSASVLKEASTESHTESKTMMLPPLPKACSSVLKKHARHESF